MKELTFKDFEFEGAPKEVTQREVVVGGFYSDINELSSLSCILKAVENSQEDNTVVFEHVAGDLCYLKRSDGLIPFSREGVDSHFFQVKLKSR
jgi:hypothetical protein